MTEQLQIVFGRIPYQGLIVLASLAGLFSVLWLVLALVKHRLTSRRIWPVAADHQTGMNIQEAERHMRQIAQHHATVRHASNAVVRTIHWSAYLNLQIIRHHLSKAPAEIITMIPASLWLFDNYYLLYKEFKKIQEAGGIGRIRRLPALAGGTAKGYPRIYALAREMVTCSNRHVDENLLARLLKQYQTGQNLTTAELWAFQNVLSLCLLEEIIIEAKKILITIETKIQAEELIKRVTAQNKQGHMRIVDLLKQAVTPEQSGNHVFLAHLILCLKRLSVDELELEDCLQSLHHAKDAASTDLLSEIVNQEAQFEAASEADISALITSLKTVGELNWEDVFTRFSALDAILIKDPAQVYGNLTSETQGSYRRVIEKLAKKFRLTETDIAEKVVQLAASRQDQPSDQSRQAHIGEYLIGQGFYDFLDHFSGSGARKRFFGRLGKGLRGFFYYIGILAITNGFLLACWLLIRSTASLRAGAMNLVMLLLILPSFELAVFLINQAFTRFVKPTALPAVDFTRKIPEDCSTFVVMPVILNTPDQIRALIKRLEKHYLANRQDNLYFALLADYHDAASATTPEDEAILSAGLTAIRALNLKYPASTTRFYLFFRPRKWNPAQGCWMGWERKRGKLEAFNALLSGESEAGIDLVAGDSVIFREIRYVITLDSDTELLRDGAAQLIGVMAHPLNQPVYDWQKNRITKGYAIVQSEISTRIATQSVSLFSRFFSGQSGIDPYATLVSDVYQDVFEEGIYAGKGIYDLRIFHQFLHGAIPENAVLSHDLLEGSLSRCAFASGIKLMDSCPSSVAAYTKREHRWIRGDWQLLPWIFSRSGINGLSRWKMLDNLRRSLARPALLLLILGNVLLLPELIWLWVFFAGFTAAYRIISLILIVFWQKLRNPTARFAKIIIFEQLSTILAQTLINIVLLPYRAYLAMDAIIRTLYRLLISHRFLLEWQSAEQVEHSMQNKPGYYWRLMWMTALPAAVVLFGAWSGLTASLTVFWAGTAAAWLLSPMIALIISTSLRHGPKLKKSSGQMDALRLTARRTWCYFADNSTIENHWLCPDNLQIQPGPKLSAKTSPTNIGLQLLSLLSARDLGYIGLYQLVRSCEVVVDTLMSLPKWHGHLYNWYNVRTLQVLSPRYVSLVDSGNFVAHLIALKNGLLDQKSADILASACIIGLADTCHLAGWSDKLDLSPPLTAADWAVRLEALQQAGLSGDTETERWQGRVQDMCLEWLEDIRRLNISGAIDKQKNLHELAQGNHPEANKLIRRIDDLVSNIDDLINNTDFRVLYDKKFGLFSIGYNVAAQTADSGHYDLLASEARVASFLAIAKGDIPQKHWFVLGRPLTLVRGIPACVSWSGSMFEYLMPSLIMKTPAGSVLQQSCLAAVIQQITYARKHKIPWGISESQYYRFDTDSNYQYGPFGVQRLRLQASLTPARVVAPYATMLALSVQPQKALENLSRLRALGAEGENGFYEALDFHQPNATSLQPFSLVSSFMAHHQGMSLVAINNFLNKAVMQRRFHREPMVQATESLLDEKRSGSIVTLASRGYTINVKVSDLADDVIESRSCRQTNLIHPLVHVLSNNHYRVMLTSDGAGFSSCDDWIINRWRPEIINNQDGQFIYIRNLTSKQCWSAAYLPTQAEADEYQAVFSHDKAEIIRRDGPVQTHTTIAVSPVNNLEVRRVTLTNQGNQALIIELTSYLEVVADGQLADALHPAFSKLFLETEYLADRHLLIANRRQRSPDDQPRYVMHALLSGQKLLRPVEFEIDRRQFIGRGGSLARPHVLDSGATLSGKAGFSTDTILSLRAVVSIPAGKTASMSFVTGFAASRADILKLSYELGKPFSAEDIFKLSSSSCKLEMKYLGISSKQINAIQNLIHCLFYPEAALYGAPEAIGRMKIGQNGLWRFGISGDHPIILLVVSQLNEMPVIKEIVTVYEYLRIKLIKADLVILNEEPSGYAQLLNHRIREMTGNLKIFSRNQPKPSLFLLQKANLSHEEHDLLMGVARLILTGKTGLYAPLGKLQQQAKPPDTKSAAIPLPAGYHPQEADLVQSPVFDGSNLEYYNGIGGFAQDGRVYEIHLQNGQKTPMPWINVIANDLFGFQVSETGSGFTWAGNSRENKLTTWHNDPILDPVSEAIYVRDDETGGITSPAALIPEHQNGHYRIEHGFGYSVFSHNELDLDQSMIVFVPPADPVRLWQLSLTNTAEKTRSVTIVLYVEWVLGVIKDQTAPYIQTAFDPDTNLLTANNRFQDAAHQHPAFIFSSEPIQAYTGDRKAFFGIGGSIRYPSGLVKDSLSNQIGVGLDPCGVIQVHVQLEPNQTKVAVFGLGQEDTLEKAIELADRYRQVRAAAEALDRVHRYWAETLGSVIIRTPDRALDLLFNGWLQYQVISCRLRARAAYYQCGGAMGFRDQLQDVLALLDADPARAREQILLCCSRQFIEGDVQHWWHPSSGLGVRTRISDDMLWIPYVTAAYIQHTGDSGILDCDVPFITGKQLDDDQAEMMILPQVSASSASVYQHCLRAIDRASQMGVQGLPLMGGGDWNDGMNRVGIGGRGESVWLGFFLYAVLQRFLPFIQQQGDLHISQQMIDLSDALLDSIERHAWDGEWYLRAFFDDGSPLGSKISDGCRIDSISQSWAVLSEGAGRIRALTALDSARRFLVREEDGISLLLAPPFDNPSHNPGYIKGYPPGIRENGGQYTHAAVWLAMAFAQVGNGHMAGQLLTMLNPIHATSTLQSANKYEKEPYVMAGDVSMGGAYNGKAGWSWYTGSAGWMYQAILQKYLGISKIGDHLVIRPAVPASFKRYVVEYRYHSALYEISIFNEPQQQGQDPTLLVDNLTIEGNRFQLIDDGAVHRVEFRIPQR